MNTFLGAVLNDQNKIEKVNIRLGEKWIEVNQDIDVTTVIESDEKSFLCLKFYIKGLLVKGHFIIIDKGMEVVSSD